LQIDLGMQIWYNPGGMDRNQILIDFERVSAFLENNQLVQSCAIAQKLENCFSDEIIRDRTGADNHPLWPSLKAIMRSRTKMLSGNRNEAAREWATANSAAKAALKTKEIP
jgi:hypothetical protein